ncbi:MAG: hypothetical protein SH848_12040 [Saprospiraceae bacterium]|nr:hypothetical protein [Saprospiraceae bacterium]MDZ4704656.1 hypothetical protein [Saprospiraceae bacterium]
MKRNKEFEHNIREKLENLAPGFNAGSWDKLQDRLDSEDAQSEWDAQLSQRLRQIERPYNRASWQALAERLDLEEKRLNGIYSAKAKELLFMALLLWSITQFLNFPPQRPTTHQAYQQTQQVAPLPLVSSNYADQLWPSDVASAGQTATPPKAETTAPERTIQAQMVSEATAENLLLPTFATTPLLSGNPELDPAYFLPGLQLLPALRNEPQAPPALEYFAEVPTSPEEYLTANALVAEASPIATSGMPQLLPERDLPLEKALQQQPLPRKRFVRIGMMGASDYNRIITPPVRVNTDIVSLDRYAIGYSGGITVGFESGRWEVETGFIYTAKRYYPLQVLYIEGSLKDGIFGGGIKQTEFDIVQVPLNFRYNFLSRDRWRIYGLAGASLHLVAQANYYIADLADYTEENQNFPLPRNSGGRNDNERPEGLENQDFQQGFLEGGSLLDNSYIGVNIGAGIERYMSPRWSLFAQPTYYHSLYYPNNGLGPVNDRIHTMSLFMGVKVRM